MRNLPEDRVSFEADERLSCKIKSGEAEFTLVKKLPPISGIALGQRKLPRCYGQRNIKDMISKTILATAKNEAKNST